MIVEFEPHGDAADAMSSRIRLKRFETPSDTEVLMYGINSTCNKSLQNKYKNYKRRVLFNYWSSCEFTCRNDAGNGFEMTDYFTEVYSVCKYTTEWMNKVSNCHKFKSIFFPIDTTYIPFNITKEYDVGYHGGIHGNIHKDCLDKIKQFKYSFLSQQHYDNLTKPPMLPYEAMLDNLSKVKISINYHVVTLNDKLKSFIKQYSFWKDNKAWSYIDSLNIFPQFKVRQHESALCKCLNLVYKDPWNIVEDYYEPNKDFIYFNNNEELPYLINNILKSWEYHQPMIESAYSKCLTYTAENLYKRICNDK